MASKLNAAQMDLAISKKKWTSLDKHSNHCQEQLEEMKNELPVLRDRLDKERERRAETEKELATLRALQNHHLPPDAIPQKPSQ